MNITTKPAIHKRVSLKSVNSFHVDAVSEYWTEIKSPQDLGIVMDSKIFNNYPYYILGGGSNILFANDFPGLVIKNSIPGISVIAEDDHQVHVRAGAGVIWDELVNFALKHGLGGIENLSMIPGLAGAAPIQNIGAYGVELESVFVSLDAIHMGTGRMTQFDHSMCRFGYRNSVFKTEKKGAYFITSVTLALSKKPVIHSEYGNILKELSADGITTPTIHDISRVVRRIRASRLPDPAKTGNAGSFFKNPLIPEDQYMKLQEQHPGIPSYPYSDKRVKIPAAWLIEQCGFRGKRTGDAGVHDHHALVIVNHGNASGRQILKLAESIQEKVFERFSIRLEPEVNII